MLLHKRSTNLCDYICGYIIAYICKTANIITHVTAHFQVAPIWAWEPATDGGNVVPEISGKDFYNKFSVIYFFKIH